MDEKVERDFQLAEIDLRRALLENMLISCRPMAPQRYDSQREEIELELRHLWAVRKKLTQGARKVC
jgi:hypothetical protein